MIGPFLASSIGGREMQPIGAEAPAARADTGTSLRLRELSQELERMRLLNQALWELLRERAGLTDEDFEAKIREIDLRDGVEDGRMTDTAVQCPRCHRISNSKHGKCLYCGTRFKQPVMR